MSSCLFHIINLFPYRSILLLVVLRPLAIVLVHVAIPVTVVPVASVPVHVGVLVGVLLAVLVAVLVFVLALPLVHLPYLWLVVDIIVYTDVPVNIVAVIFNCILLILLLAFASSWCCSCCPFVCLFCCLCCCSSCLAFADFLVLVVVAIFLLHLYYSCF